MAKKFSIAILILTCNLALIRAQGADNALVFDGTDDIVTVSSSSGDELNPLNTITVESWVYLTEAPADGIHRPHFLGKNASYQLIVETNGYPRFYINSGGIYTYAQGATLIETDKWYHIAGTYDGSYVRIYVNGMLEASVALVGGTIAQNNQDVSFGNRENGVEALSGMMDDIRIWNVARTESQIQENLSQKLVGNEPNLIGYWMLDATSGFVATDATSANNGALVNMNGTEWTTSTAPIGDASIFSAATNIVETAECEVDVTFGTVADAPGVDTAIAVMQVNETPNLTTGIYGSAASTYWEIISEDIDFDANFTATVNFHYDNVTGISDETQLTLYRRDDASAISWSEVVGATIVTTDGASSTTDDGTGYAQIIIDEVTVGGFSGQYILGWNNNPETTVPGETIDEGGTFATITLDNYVTDAEDADADITWAYSGNTSLNVTIENRVATISTPVDNPDWFGTETITFTATDTEGGQGSNEATFTVTAVNDAPIVGDIPSATIDEDGTFATIDLNTYVEDVDNANADITWSYSGNSDLTVSIDANNIATITASDDWNGSVTITFTATDLDGAFDSDDAVFEVTAVNDAPIVGDIPGETIDEDGTFATIDLNTYVEDVDNANADITWSYSGNSDLTVSIDANNIATITASDDWNGSVTITFTATDLDGAFDSDDAVFEVTAVNDAPIVGDIPGETIDEDGTFTLISLNDFVEDVEDADADITWSYLGNSELVVAIDANNVATITAPADWNGSETITFTATDLDGGSNSDDAIFEVTAVNDAPIVGDIPGETIEEDGTFATIDLNAYVEDAEDADADITWSYLGNSELTVSIDASNIATITAPADWNGSETITFTATDLDGGTDSDDAIFEVTAVNDAPIVGDIPGETIEEDGTFATIDLNTYVEDAEDADADITWSYLGNSELTVSIDASNIATITAPVDWNGSETITFTATDLDGGTDSDDAIFEATAVNDAPVVDNIPGETINEGSNFATINLNDYVTDVEDADASIDWSYSGNSNLTLSINTNNVVTVTPSADWTGTEVITFTATDLDGGFASDTAIFTVNELVGVESISSIISMDVYPNPGKGVFKVNTQLSKSQNITLNVFSITGELILNEQYNSGHLGKNTYELDLSNVTKGLYLVEVISEDNSRLLKRLVIK